MFERLAERTVRGPRERVALQRELLGLLKDAGDGFVQEYLAGFVPEYLDENGESALGREPRFLHSSITAATSPRTPSP